jgi:2-polyprenyl-3-methyl-5-hydroxy-6-metoxy-1,4-benzoquinol methylase
MKRLDRILQRWRIAKASKYISKGARVLDIGCGDGTLFRVLQSNISEGIGIDPDLDHTIVQDRYTLLRGTFPQDVPKTAPFDVITMLAVLEHVPPHQQLEMACKCAVLLRPGGYLVITVPSALVDPILDLLKAMRLIDGQALHEHYGFDHRNTPTIFASDSLTLLIARKFQIGLNNLYVFRRKESK